MIIVISHGLKTKKKYHEKKSYIVKLINTLFGIIIVWMMSISVHANIANCISVYEVTANQLNIRNKANNTGKIIGTYKHGDKVCINSESDNWFDVSDKE